MTCEADEGPPLLVIRRRPVPIMITSAKFQRQLALVGATTGSPLLIIQQSRFTPYSHELSFWTPIQRA